ncbi:winged helix-turn-helix domain-containing protein [Streptomyces sp. NPDC045456]|uniref:ArsR/SmtB family transcription factor n=1 Tax=Streptomyces sp. NPDC045456 TaxID=3155254 RepID=UPI0033F76B33
MGLTGVQMIHVSANAGLLADTRFALSPLLEAAVTMHHRHAPQPPHHLPPWARTARDPAVWDRLPLLSQIFTSPRFSTTDFFCMDLPITAHPDIDAELHHMVTAPAGRITKQLYGLLRLTVPPGPRADEVVHRAVDDFLVSGERSCAQRIAEEVSRFWRLCLAPYWPVIEERTRADISHRAAISASEGLRAGLSSLHPAVSYAHAAIRIDSAAETVVEGYERFTLVPSVSANRCFLGSDHRPGRGAYLIYPARETGSQRTHAPSQESLGNVLGHTRLALLASMARPRTTTELAEQHRLSPSTVSYHLSRMYEAGLLVRTPDGGNVFYHRTGEAERLLAGRGEQNVTRVPGPAGQL